VSEPDPVRHRFREGKRAPHTVEAGAEDRHALGAVAPELDLEVVADAFEVLFERDPLAVSQILFASAVRLGALVEKRVESRLRVSRRRRRAGVEIEVEADRETPFGLDTGQVAKLFPCHGSCHRSPPVGFPLDLRNYTLEHDLVAGR